MRYLMRFDEIGRDSMGFNDIAELGRNDVGTALARAGGNTMHTWLQRDASATSLAARWMTSAVNSVALTPKSNGVNAVENWALTPWKSGVNAVENSALTPQFEGTQNVVLFARKSLMLLEMGSAPARLLGSRQQISRYFDPAEQIGVRNDQACFLRNRAATSDRRNTMAITICELTQ